MSLFYVSTSSGGTRRVSTHSDIRSAALLADCRTGLDSAGVTSLEVVSVGCVVEFWLADSSVLHTSSGYNLAIGLLVVPVLVHISTALVKPSPPTSNFVTIANRQFT